MIIPKLLHSKPSPQLRRNDNTLYGITQYFRNTKVNGSLLFLRISNRFVYLSYKDITNLTFNVIIHFPLTLSHDNITSILHINIPNISHLVYLFTVPNPLTDGMRNEERITTNRSFIVHTVYRTSPELNEIAKQT